MVGILEPDEIADLLRESAYGRLGCHAGGKTYVVPISYAMDGDDRIIGQTTHGLKVEMMRGNPEVCIEVDDVKSLVDWRSAIVWGRFEELAGVEAARAAGLLIDKYGPEFQEMAGGARRGRETTPPRADSEFAAPIVYAVSIMEKTGRFERP